MKDNDKNDAYLKLMPENLKTIFAPIIARQKEVDTEHYRNLVKVLKKAFIIAICKQREQSTQLETEDATSIITQWAEGNQDTTWAIDQLDLLVGKLPKSTQALYDSRLQAASDPEKIILYQGPVPSLIASLKKPFDPNDPKNMKPTLLAERNALHMQIVALLPRNAPPARAHPPFTVTSTNPPQIIKHPSAKQRDPSLYEPLLDKHASVRHPSGRPPTNQNSYQHDIRLMLFGRPREKSIESGGLREPLLKDENTIHKQHHTLIDNTLLPPRKPAI